jgi:FixJ family two-component response regulator
VYVVDDDPSVRKAIARLLDSVGLRSRTFGSADEFLAEAELTTPGCAILDVRMPGSSGLDLQRELLASGVSIPVIFVTAHANVPMAVRAMKAGALEVLTKPFDDQELLDAVHEALSRDRTAWKEREETARLRERLEHLTAREREVMALVATGMINKEVAAALGTSEKTVKAHRSQVMHKLGAESLADLVRIADRLGIVASKADRNGSKGPGRVPLDQ